jgi:hypothetical protein
MLRPQLQAQLTQVAVVVERLTVAQAVQAVLVSLFFHFRYRHPSQVSPPV